MAFSVRSIAVRSWEALRAFWLIMGMCLLLFVLVEVGIRVQRTMANKMRTARPTAAAVVDPRTKTSWYADYMTDFNATRAARWKSYVYFSRFPSYSGRYVNIDRHGRRVTPQPSVPAVPAARVFFFGGSTMWGTSQRDDRTIPAEASRRLQELAGPGARIEVTNFGDNGYVFTQEIIELMMQLRLGNTPDVVVFFDGLNDAGATVQSGSAGLPQNESNRAAEFTMGRALDRNAYGQGIRRDLRAWSLLTSKGLDQSAVIAWMKRLKPAVPFAMISADSAARSTARIYTANARLVEALAKEYGFTPIYVWQPNLHMTPKPLSPFETGLLRQIKADPFHNRLRDVHLAVPAMLDASMPAVAPGRFINESSLFKGDTTHVFVDRVGHNTEEAIPTIVDAFWPALRAAMALKRARTFAVLPQ